jgi:hypothetical protein
MKFFSKKWGPYIADRQWGVVREDYSPDGAAWEYTTHDQARSKAWRWGEDALGGYSDDQQLLCLAPACWNGQDPILKERLFGLTNSEGNHGEDVKELYYYLDAAPDHRYLRMLYKYPQAAFPYERLLDENRRRSRRDPEFEIMETGVFDHNRYFDMFIEYAFGASDDDVLMRITVENRASETAWLAVLPTVWFRNTWAFGLSDKPKPQLWLENERIVIRHPELGPDDFHLFADAAPQWLFCENETNTARLFDIPNAALSAKDGINDFVVGNNPDTLNTAQRGTKAAAFYQADIAGGGSAVFRLRLVRATASKTPTRPFADFDAVFKERRAETDHFYQHIPQNTRDTDRLNVQRQAWAGMIWSKQFYFYHVARWLQGDPGQPEPPADRRWGRNRDWPAFESAHILSMPDTWEYPWFAAWDLAFQAVVFAYIDPDFAKDQLRTLHGPRFRRPDGALPAYEWNFDDVNPPVQAWATWRVFETEKTATGAAGDLAFLSAMYPDLRAAYDWWMAQKDTDGNDLFSGGFLGLDNIGIFNRSESLPDGSRLEQADATAWAGFYALQMLRIALHLAQNDALRRDYYQDQAFDFFQHFLRIAYAIGSPDDHRTLWDDTDGFFYDTLRFADETHFSFKVRSLVGLIPMLSVLTLEQSVTDALPDFTKKVADLLAARPDLAAMISRWHDVQGEKRLLSMLRGHRLKCLLRRMLDPAAFLSDFGVRSLSREHLDHPCKINWRGQEIEANYSPGESDSDMFGGNSNWRGPVWMPLNFLLIESLQTFHTYYSDDFVVECPVGSGQLRSLNEVARLLAMRLEGLFLRRPDGTRPLFGAEQRFSLDPFFRDLTLFYEYFDGDTGRGCGASHQTGWTGLIAALPFLYGNPKTV